jgi:hypothetical protein
MSTLTREELEDFWALGVPLEAKHVPLDEIASAVRESRVKEAFSTSSMGTAETYWFVVAADADVTPSDDWVVVPPGQRAVETSWEDRADDSKERALWEPFWREQAWTVCDQVTPELAGAFRSEIEKALARLGRTAMQRALRATRPRHVEALRFELLRMGVRLVREAQRARNATNAP